MTTIRRSCSRRSRKCLGYLAERDAEGGGRILVGSGSAAVSHREFTTALTTTMTTVGLPDTFTYTTIELVSCLVRTIGLCPRIRRFEVFESLRAHPAQRHVRICRPVRPAYRRAGLAWLPSHTSSRETAQISRRLFDANDPEWTGIAQFWPESSDDQLPCGTTEDESTGTTQTYGSVIRWSRVGVAPAPRQRRLENLPRPSTHSVRQPPNSLRQHRSVRFRGGRHSLRCLTRYPCRTNVVTDAIRR